MPCRICCPACQTGSSRHYTDVDGHAYFQCDMCASLHIAPEVLEALDRGEHVLGAGYAAEYWQQERDAAIERASGLSIARAGEAILYCRRPVHRFLDVGSGPGFLVQQLQQRLDPDATLVHGVERFPPAYAVDCPNIHHGGVEELRGTFDAGVCIEVIEHLTPSMLAGMAAGLAGVSAPGTLWLFNTGMPGYVVHEDPGYLDPLRRGHIVSYGIRAIEAIFAPLGFSAQVLPGKSYAFIAEYRPFEKPDFNARIYHPLPHNLQLLNRDGLLYQAAFEAARASYYYDGYLQRTAWAVSLDEQLRRLQARGRVRGPGGR